MASFRHAVARLELFTEVGYHAKLRRRPIKNLLVGLTPPDPRVSWAAAGADVPSTNEDHERPGRFSGQQVNLP